MKNSSDQTLMAKLKTLTSRFNLTSEEDIDFNFAQKISADGREMQTFSFGLLNINAEEGYRKLRRCFSEQPGMKDETVGIDFEVTDTLKNILGYIDEALKRSEQLSIGFTDRLVSPRKPGSPGRP